MSYPINYPTPQGANVQIFQGGDPQTTAHTFEKTWVKPQGASFVYFSLIGSGGGTNSSADALLGGGSGAVTNFMCPAFLIPDSLAIVIGVGGTPNTEGTATQIFYQQKTGAGYTLLSASGGGAGNLSNNGAGGAAFTANAFTAMGFLQSVAGQDGVNAAQSASGTTFLSGGSYTSTVTGNYGYTTGTRNGIFQNQPIIVGTGGGGTQGKGGIGCGGGGAGGGNGGDGLVVIITW